jgi:molybdate/tungstate transport system substrate-binding protein
MPIVYGITIPRDAEHRALAEQFVAFLLSDKGKEVFEKNGQPFVPFKANIPVENLPNSIKDAIQKGQ